MSHDDNGCDHDPKSPRRNSWETMGMSDELLLEREWSDLEPFGVSLIYPSSGGAGDLELPEVVAQMVGMNLGWFTPQKVLTTSQ